HFTQLKMDINSATPASISHSGWSANRKQKTIAASSQNSARIRLTVCAIARTSCQHCDRSSLLGQPVVACPCLRYPQLLQGAAMSHVTAIPEEDLELLRRFDTPTVCNVVELLDLRPRTAGYMDARIQACYPKLPPMVGYACTATFRSLAPARAGNVYSGLVEQVSAFAQGPRPPVVVFQDLDVPSAAATFGEVMCTTYKAFGAVGLITSGAARDLDQVEALAFQC